MTRPFIAFSTDTRVLRWGITPLFDRVHLGAATDCKINLLLEKRFIPFSVGYATARRG